MAHPTLIFCHGGNRTMAQIAINNGFKYGARLPDTVYFPLYFADQNWKKPNRNQYTTLLASHKPALATVLDLERPDQHQEVLHWAEDIAPYVETIIIIPKYTGAIQTIPNAINSRPVILGYSVPTKYAGTSVPIWEFANRPVHLLGGSPQQQMQFSHYLNVASADGNMASAMATRLCAFWTPKRIPATRSRYWATLKEADGYIYGSNAPYEAFQRSCQNIKTAWQTLYQRTTNQLPLPIRELS